MPAQITPSEDQLRPQEEDDEFILLCTCDNWMDQWRHYPHCDLWDDDAFLEGEAKWDPYSAVLVPCGYDEMPPDAMSWGPFIGQHHMEDDDDPVIVDAEIVDSPEEKPLSWKRTNVYSTMRSHPDADADGRLPGVIYDCLCTIPEKSYCSECGVTKKGGKWAPTMPRRDRESQNDGKYWCYCNPQKQWCCSTCDVQLDEITKVWLFWDSDSYFSRALTKCRHYMEKLTMPDGTEVYASSEHKRKPTDPHPDLGIYAYNGWNPTSAALYINWPDYSVPAIPYADVDWMIRTSVTWAKDGYKVEAGCMGGHGRTGSILALMALYCGAESGEAAVKHVRENYCEYAIEGQDQEWYITAFHAWMNDLPIPPKPVKQTKTTTTVTTVTDSSGQTAIATEIASSHANRDGSEGAKTNDTDAAAAPVVVALREANAASDEPSATQKGGVA